MYIERLILVLKIEAWGSGICASIQNCSLNKLYKQKYFCHHPWLNKKVLIGIFFAFILIGIVFAKIKINNIIGMKIASNKKLGSEKKLGLFCLVLMFGTGLATSII
jgi:hypothetical protein